ncbi:penicillin-binding transpeptidase domain-containing protein [Streptomyces lichenis]|uniref:Penicillin-binding transpeptidase domain-containing protein n=1 Tax=Streptomyces lichenis TaxID=2306967 RepID=A0ABT0IFV5_9ACTN|nr:penicillin-binding transpeptidase domain-containing protein [Streptomyces lichenis]MCK8680176.1 penicillin-binding transpeptidase domain-containing protein [Streptomyces lichenis]
MRSGAKVAIVGGAFVLVAGGVGYAGFNLWNGITGGVDNVGEARPLKASGPITAEETERTSRDFLAAWAKGDAEAAGQLTNDPANATPVVGSFREAAHVAKAVITPGTASGTTVPYTVKATVSHQGHSKVLSYSSKLTVVRGATTGRPLVDWAPTVLHPKLTKGASLRTGEAETAAIEAVDRQGRKLTREKYPSLGTVLDTLRTRYADQVEGEPGIETWIEPASADAPNQTLLTLTKGVPGKLRTTLDAEVQAAAERAVKRFGQASVVAIRPSTGEISAVANNPATGFNTAMQGAQAPGSTMKIVTAAMMLDRGVVDGPSSPVECPEEVQWKGGTFHNLDHFSIPDGGSLTESFRRSCNTAFIKAVGPLSEKDVEDTALGETARKYFGLGGVWSTGIPSSDASVPASQGSETAASYIGQGKVTMNALSVASIAATAKSGAFHQPVLVPKELIKGEITTAQPLPGNIASALRAMMSATATTGTGAQAMASVGGDKGAKTGSAEVDGQSSSNSWFTGYADDLAAASVVQSGGHGGDSAGKVVADVLNAR